MSDPTTRSTVPPFIPGLIIVGFLIIISLTVGWRNYARRRDTQLTMPGIGEWEFWSPGDGLEGEGRRGRPEKPKIWEVGVAARASCEKDEAEWERVMPLSVVELTAEPSPVRLASDPEFSRHPGSAALSSRLARLNFFSSSPGRPPASPPSHQMSQLQVSVMVSMPSSHRPRCQHPQPNSDAAFGKSSECLQGRPASPAEAGPNDTLSSIWNEKLNTDTDAIEALPEVVFGVAVLPWRRNDERPESGGVLVPS